MKRILSLLLTLFVLLSAFYACNSETETDISSQSDISEIISQEESSVADSSDDSSADESITDSESSANGESSEDISDDTSEDTSQPDDEPVKELYVPQRLFVTDGREVYTRLYSMFVSGNGDKDLMTDAANLRELMRGTAPVSSAVGGAEYKGKIYTTGDYIVKTDDDLKAAVNKAKSGEVIFIPSGVTVDVADLYTTEKFVVALKAGVILASDRGINEGGVLKISHPMGAVITCGNNATVTGLNICGVITAFDENTANLTDIGIRINGKNVKISNCEFASFSGSAILLPNVSSVEIDNCYFHHCETAVRNNGNDISVTNSAFYANNSDYKKNSANADLPKGNVALKNCEIPELIAKRVNPDIVIASFPADGYEVYSLLGRVATGSLTEIVNALAIHSGTTEYYKFKDKLTIKQNGKVYGINEDIAKLGGGAEFDKIYTSGDYTVTDASSLIAALKKAKSGETVFIPGDKQIDLTGYTVNVPAGVTLASDRGRKLDDGTISTGAMIYTTVRQGDVFTIGKNSVVSGITLIGPDTERHMTHIGRGLNAEGNKYTEYYYKLPLTRGITINGNGAVVANCEIAGFSNAGVYVRSSVDVKVHHCFIHHNQRNGFGYGIVIYSATYVEIYGNLFNFDRHAIAADGAAHSGYQAHNNVHMGTAIYHIFDAHGGGDRGDGTDIACERVDMNNNVFLSDKIPYKKRGTPQEYSKFTRNIIIYDETFYPYRQMYGNNFICEDNIWGIGKPATPDYSFNGGRTFTFNASGDTRFYSGMEYIDSATHSLRYAYILVFTPTKDGYYISEYGNNLDNGSIQGWNEKVTIPKGGFVIAFTQKSPVAKQLYDAISARHGVIYNTTIGLDGDYIATLDGKKITVTQSK